MGSRLLVDFYLFKQAKIGVLWDFTCCFCGDLFFCYLNVTPHLVQNTTTVIKSIFLVIPNNIDH